MGKIKDRAQEVLFECYICCALALVVLKVKVSILSERILKRFRSNDEDV
jgi:hypothetical protein